MNSMNMIVLNLTKNLNMIDWNIISECVSWVFAIFLIYCIFSCIVFEKQYREKYYLLIAFFSFLLFILKSFEIMRLAGIGGVIGSVLLFVYFDDKDSRKESIMLILIFGGITAIGSMMN